MNALGVLPRPRIAAMAADILRIDGEIERDLYVALEDGRIFSMHFDAGSTTAGRWVELPRLPLEDVA